MLRAVAELARGQVRRGELLARHGGEEFVILAADCRLPEAGQLAERLRRALSGTPIRLPDGQALHVKASFGLACADADAAPDLDGLFREADRALYHAKAQGRDRVCAGTGRALSDAG